jgi:cellobiose phosphorylase
VEIWLVTLRNLGAKPRRLSLFSYLEWLLGAAPDWHREFHKTFIETAFEREGSVILATKCNWEPPIPESSHWNIDWPYVAFHSASHGIAGFETDKQAFLGRMVPCQPQALRRVCRDHWSWGDAIASIQINRLARADETVVLVGAR